MALTKLNFNEIENASETSNTININKTTILNQEVILPTKTPTVNESNGTIWVDSISNNLKIKVNSVIYDLSPQIDYNNISVSTSSVISLNGSTGVINNLTISGSGTVLEIRSSAIGGAQWSNLEILGNLNIASGTTLRLTRVPLIVRGSIIGNGTITSPDGTNGGAAGVGGSGGTGGYNGYYMSNNVTPGTGTGQPGTNSPSTWPNQNGGSAISMPVEYGISSGSGGPGGRGTAGGGGGGHRYSSYNSTATSGGSSGNGNPGGGGYNERPESSYYLIMISGGGGGAGGPGTPGSGSTPLSIPPGGPAATGISGTNGGPVGVLSTPYTGIGTPTSSMSGTSGTSGGAGGNGGRYNTWYAPTSDDLPTNGSPGGAGGNGGAGGGTGGAHLSIYSGGPISTSINIRTGKGGLTGGSTSLPRAQTGSLWLFTPTGSETISGIDLTGASGTPTGPNGVSNRYAISNSTEVSNFFTGILYEASGVTPAKVKVAITYP
jgi:hypothetical protein